jgi:aminoglycoside phosphotransferase family enzyme
MEESEVREMASRGLAGNKLLGGTVEETHISWVILTRKYAYKIKKPLKLSFLDFSTIALRKKYCEREVSLNSRFSDIYLSAAPIRFTGGQWVIGGEGGEPVEYCVVMKRMTLSKRMDNQLRSHSVKDTAMKTLAKEVALFHKKAEKIFTPFDLVAARNTFNDIDLIKDFSTVEIGAHFRDIITQSISWSDAFLETHVSRMQQRIDHGLKRDVHGDLHSGNIFLYGKPVLFDCIEFNDQYRQIDVLYEIAFLCMELEIFHQKNLSTVFLAEYKKYFPCFQAQEDEYVFIYFKCLRANIRAKVHAMNARQADHPGERSLHVAETRKYLVMMNDYRACLQAMTDVSDDKGLLKDRRISF